jgi:hypothetical protein
MHAEFFGVFFLVQVFNPLCPCGWGLELFLLGFQKFSSERVTLESLHHTWSKVLVVVQITTFLPSVKELGFLQSSRFLLFSPQWGSWCSHSLVGEQGLSCR